jgi:superfamily I DNA/RNA helicase
MRVQILDQIVFPFLKSLADENIHEWNELTRYKIPNRQYDAIVCDETQDFTANQLRTINSHLSSESSLTIVIDTAQRIYARGYKWLETGIVVRPERSHRLTINYRNSKEIALLAASLLHNIPVDDDSTVPSLEQTISSGNLPDIIEASYSNQVDFTLRHIDKNVDLENETVAFLHPKGGNWFKYLQLRLTQHGLKYISLTRMYEWPQGDESIGLCTLHSAKGLEFHHVFVLGLNSECLSDWEDADDHRYITTRKLLGMGIGRAKKSVIIGYKSEEKSEIIDLIDPKLYNLVKI